MAKDVKIIPLDTGTMEADSSLFTLRRGMGVKAKGAFIATFIDGLEKKVLVDTGPSGQERAWKYHSFHNPSVSPEQEAPRRLLQMGVKPEEIEILILTHLHWDHCGQADKFPNARIFVAREEFKYAMCPLPPNQPGYEALQLGMDPIFLRVIRQMEYLDQSEREIIPGLKVFPAPGHTPGSIAVEVMTGEGPCIIAGDAVNVYANLKGDPAHNLPFLMYGSYVDLAAAWRSMEQIYRRAQFDLNRVIPGHDPEVLRRKSFP